MTTSHLTQLSAAGDKSPAGIQLAQNSEAASKGRKPISDLRKLTERMDKAVRASEQNKAKRDKLTKLIDADEAIISECLLEINKLRNAAQAASKK